MSTAPKSILVISHKEALRYTCSAVLKSGGYKVLSVAFDDEAMALLEKGDIDLVPIGRKTSEPGVEIDERLRERFPKLLILKIAELDARAMQFIFRAPILTPLMCSWLLKRCWANRCSGTKRKPSCEGCSFRGRLYIRLRGSDSFWLAFDIQLKYICSVMRENVLKLDRLDCSVLLTRNRKP